MNNDIIYALIDPETNETRYVGKTTKRWINRRYWQHLNVRGQNAHKDNWINKLLLRNLKPIMIILEECNDDNWKEKEIYWIKQYDNLVNICEGGTGIAIKGEKHYNRKINKSDVLIIANLYKTTNKNVDEIAKELGFTRSIVSNIVHGYSWLSVTGGKVISDFNKRIGKKNINVGSSHPLSKLNESDVIDIKQRLMNGETKIELSKIYSVSFATISFIASGKSWKHVTI